MVGVFERVYETGKAFRAEPHDTSRHLAEYTSLDAELGFIRDHTTRVSTTSTSRPRTSACARSGASGYS